VRAALIAFVAGCGASVPPPVAAPVPQPQATPLAVAIAPARAKPVEGRTRTLERYNGRDVITTHLSRDEVILLDRRTRSIEMPDVSEIDFLGRCARDFVEGQPDTVRKVLIDALSHYVTGCEEGKLVLERPLGFDARDRRSHTDIAFVGTLGRNGAGLMLKATSCGPSSAFERITVVSSGQVWTSPRVELRRDTNNCTISELPYTRVLAKVIRSAIENGETTIQFEGSTSELVLDESTRDELRAVLDAVDVISDP
jgi:hypothetical protein